jgi:hypothetical protein
VIDPVRDTDAQLAGDHGGVEVRSLERELLGGEVEEVAAGAGYRIAQLEPQRDRRRLEQEAVTSALCPGPRRKCEAATERCDRG